MAWLLLAQTGPVRAGTARGGGSGRPSPQEARKRLESQDLGYGLITSLASMNSLIMIKTLSSTTRLLVSLHHGTPGRDLPLSRDQYKSPGL